MKLLVAAMLIIALLWGGVIFKIVSSSNPLPDFPNLAVSATSKIVSTSANSSNTTAFSVGPGWADVVPHQIVRTADDRLYFFGIKGESSSVLEAYWTTTSGLPNTGSDFTGSLTKTYSANILSVATVYDGSHILHILSNGQDGKIIDNPFDTNTNQFKAGTVLATTGDTVNGTYLGTSGIAGMMDKSLVMHIVYWSASNHITYLSYTYNVAQNILTKASGPTQLDSSGSANHPALAISPVDGSVVVAWVSQATSPAKILAKTKNSGSWGSIETVSSAPVWTSASSGINIDQGPSLVIGSNGTKYLAYIEDYRVISPYDYGRVHYVTNTGSGWSDQYIGSYSHDPAISINSAGQIYILGHGWPLNSACTSHDDECIFSMNSNGTWAAPRVLIAHQGTQSFDSSTSVKWSVVGYNRPDTIEFFFAEVGAGYSNPVIYYGRISIGSSLPRQVFLPCVMR